MASRLPVEIWTIIFEEIIDVPEFFSVDPLTSYGVAGWSKFHLEGFYWRAERWRNALRRVHSRWNAILDQPRYQHRFVRMRDVTQGRVREQDVPWEKTLRIAFGADLECSCQRAEYRRKRNGRWVEATWVKKCRETQDLMGRIVTKYRRRKNGSTNWSLRIVDGPRNCLPLSKVVYALSKVANITNIKGHTTWDAVAPYAANLNLLHTVFRPSHQRRLGAIPTSFPHLTTLMMHIEFSPFKFKDLSVPSLQHLEIIGHPDRCGQISWIRGFMTLLDAVGNNLRTLHCRQDLPGDIIPPRFWQLVPKLTQIQLICNWKCPPPPDHPLATVQIPGRTIEIGSPDYQVPIYPLDFRCMPGWLLWSASTPTLVGPDYEQLTWEWSGRKLRIAMTDVWERVFFNSSYRERCLFLSEQYDTLRWTFTDYTGWTFNTFLVSLLESRRIARMTRNWDWIPRGYLRTTQALTNGELDVRMKREDVGDRGILEAEVSDFDHF